MRKETTPDRLPGIDPGALSAPAIIYLARAALMPLSQERLGARIHVRVIRLFIVTVKYNVATS